MHSERRTAQGTLGSFVLTAQTLIARWARTAIPEPYAHHVPEPCEQRLAPFPTSGLLVPWCSDELKAARVLLEDRRKWWGRCMFTEAPAMPKEESTGQGTRLMVAKVCHGLLSSRRWGEGGFESALGLCKVRFNVAGASWKQIRTGQIQG